MARAETYGPENAFHRGLPAGAAQFRSSTWLYRNGDEVTLVGEQHLHLRRQKGPGLLASIPGHSS
ncbi:hypothetical protein, partial [Pseudomonas sp. NBRC 111118]|uniref:hypothetical protein n=1 Tax=Pseudomonas sp. NBRC 111118 TaxID=1661033 RepID=UPI001C44EA07